MSHQATTASTDQTRAQSVVNRNLARVLALLENDQAGKRRIADCGERGVRASAQAVYMLRLAGHDVDRVHCEHPDRPATRRVLGAQHSRELIATDIDNCRGRGSGRRL
jgi:hypothetical protein